MISFSISLSMNQLAMLQAIRKTQDATREYFSKEKNRSHPNDDNPQQGMSLAFRNWVSLSRHPLAEGFMRWVKVSDKWNYGYWELTRKGELVLEMVKIEMRETMTQFSSLNSDDQKKLN